MERLVILPQMRSRDLCNKGFGNFGQNLDQLNEKIQNLELQYRGRIRELKDLKPIKDGDSDLLKAMKLIAETGNGPKNQIPSMGCNIKWFK